jgi:uncharacterized damage-inducible protein DinB
LSNVVDCPAVDGVENAEIALLLRQLDEGTWEWLTELGEVSETELTWQVFENGHSIATLLVHIAEVEAYWLHHVGAGQPYQDLEDEYLDGEAIDQGSISWPTAPPGRPLSHYTDLLKTTRARTKELLSSAGSPMTEVRERKDGKRFTLFWLLTHVMQHEAYHGGQAVLLQLMQRKAATS